MAAKHNHHVNKMRGSPKLQVYRAAPGV